MITITLGDLLLAEPALDALCAQPLAARTAYHLKRLHEIVAREARRFTEVRDNLIRSLGTPRADGGFEILPDNPNRAPFTEQITELADEPIEIPARPITLDMLGTAVISAQQLAALGTLFEEETPPDARV